MTTIPIGYVDLSIVYVPGARCSTGTVRVEKGVSIDCRPASVAVGHTPFGVQRAVVMRSSDAFLAFEPWVGAEGSAGTM